MILVASDADALNQPQSCATEPAAYSIPGERPAAYSENRIHTVQGGYKYLILLNSYDESVILYERILKY